MELKNEFELVVSEGQRHVLETMLAAVFFSVFVFLVFSTLYYTLFEPSLPDFLDNLFKTFGTGLVSLSMGLNFATTKTVLIDTDKNKLISRYHVGPIAYNRVSEVPGLEYVSVFKNAKDVFEVNLWYQGNKHYKMYAFEIKEQAFHFATLVSSKLKLELLDATQKGNLQWIEKHHS